MNNAINNILAVGLMAVTALAVNPLPIGFEDVVSPYINVLYPSSNAKNSIAAEWITKDGSTWILLQSESGERDHGYHINVQIPKGDPIQTLSIVDDYRPANDFDYFISTVYDLDGNPITLDSKKFYYPLNVSSHVDFGQDFYVMLDCVEVGGGHDTEGTVRMILESQALLTLRCHYDDLTICEKAEVIVRPGERIEQPKYIDKPTEGNWKLMNVFVDNSPVEYDEDKIVINPTINHVTLVDYYFVDLDKLDPVLEINKTSNFEGQLAAPGDTITYTVVVKNAGLNVISDIYVKDLLEDATLISGESDFIDQLVPEDSIELHYQYTVKEKDIINGEIINAVTAAGYSPIGKEAYAEDFVTDLTIPMDSSIEMYKKSNLKPGEWARLGQKIIFTINVRNRGNVTVSNITVEDELYGTELLEGESNFISKLEPNQEVEIHYSYIVTEMDILNGSIFNSAFASGYDPIGNETYSDCSLEEITEYKTLRLDLKKVSNVEGSAFLGDIIIYTVTVGNKSNVTISNIRIYDELTGAMIFDGESEIVPSLAPGENAVVHYSYVVTENDVTNGIIVNSVTASGTDPFGDPVSEEASCEDYVDTFPEPLIAEFTLSMNNDKLETMRIWTTYNVKPTDLIYICAAKTYEDAMNNIWEPLENSEMYVYELTFDEDHICTYKDIPFTDDEINEGYMFFRPYIITAEKIVCPGRKYVGVVDKPVESYGETAVGVPFVKCLSETDFPELAKFNIPDISISELLQTNCLDKSLDKLAIMNDPIKRTFDWYTLDNNFNWIPWYVEDSEELPPTVNEFNLKRGSAFNLKHMEKYVYDDLVIRIHGQVNEEQTDWDIDQGGLIQISSGIPTDLDLNDSTCGIIGTVDSTITYMTDDDYTYVIYYGDPDGNGTRWYIRKTKVSNGKRTITIVDPPLIPTGHSFWFMDGGSPAIVTN